MQQDVLPTTKKVVESAKYVFINKDAIKKFSDTFSPENVETSELEEHPKIWNIAQSVGLVCIFNCVNFCFWAPKGEPKWTIRLRDGRTLDGAHGAFAALKQALLDGAPLGEAHFLSELTRDKLAQLFNGNIEIPLLDERLECLKEAGRVLLKNFEGNFINVYEASGKDAVRLTDIFIEYFPSFNDFAVTDGSKVEFHKRAQLNTDMINYRLAKMGEKELNNLDKLTAFADYKVPQILRKTGIIEYAPELAERVDSYIEIPAGTREEIEIRASTIWAVEEMKAVLLPKYPGTGARQLDDHLWSISQKKSPDDKPYHRTKTIFY